ncbi:hypothetical protein ACH5RR_009358 [Cinchona calisaya]|uniref:Uncharacterized protein n=1 Tax=Cinchona calisaya TaxID=153742 RepID=A0ABD3AGF2_9GENT
MADALAKVSKDVICPNIGDKEGKHLKLLVEVDISKPLFRGTLVRSEGEWHWTGHLAKSCVNRGQTEVEEGDSQYGYWLKASVVWNKKLTFPQSELKMGMIQTNESRPAAVQVSNNISGSAHNAEMELMGNRKVSSYKARPYTGIDLQKVVAKRDREL